MNLCPTRSWCLCALSLAYVALSVALALTTAAGLSQAGPVAIVTVSPTPVVSGIPESLRLVPASRTSSSSGTLQARQNCAPCVLAAIRAAAAARAAQTVRAANVVTAKRLARDLVLAEARAGEGTVIIRNLGDTPRLNAMYGRGEWVKMQHVHYSLDGGVTTTVHWHRNLTSGVNVEYKVVR